MSQFIGRLLVVLAFGWAGSTSAALIERDATLDLASISLPTSDISESIHFNSATIDVGDTFIFHLDFGGDSLRIIDIDGDSQEYMGWQFVSSVIGGTGFLWDTTFHYEGVEGDLLTNDFTLGFGGPIGAFLPNWNLTNTEFSFTGVTLEFDVTYKEPGRSSFTTEIMDFRATFFRPTSGVLTSVPAPGTIPLFAIALAGLGWSRRKKA